MVPQFEFCGCHEPSGTLIGSPSACDRLIPQKGPFGVYVATENAGQHRLPDRCRTRNDARHHG